MKASTRELSVLSVSALEDQLVEAQKELVNLRFGLATRQMSNYARLKVVRRDIARLNFFIDEKRSLPDDAS